MQGIIDFFQEINYYGWQDNVKIIFLALSFIFLFIAIFAFIKAHLILKGHQKHFIREHSRATSIHHESESADGIPKQWERVVESINSVRDAEWKLAVIEADKFVDDALKSRGFAGESMGERLMLIKPDQLNSIQDLWDAHKLRNLLVHETNYNLRHEQAVEAVLAFEKVLKELGVFQ